MCDGLGISSYQTVSGGVTTAESEGCLVWGRDGLCAGGHQLGPIDYTVTAADAPGTQEDLSLQSLPTYTYKGKRGHSGLMHQRLDECGAF